MRGRAPGREFDIAFWQALGPNRIFEAACDLVVTTAAVRGMHENQLRLQRSVTRLERRGVIRIRIVQFSLARHLADFADGDVLTRSGQWFPSDSGMLPPRDARRASANGPDHRLTTITFVVGTPLTGLRSRRNAVPEGLSEYQDGESNCLRIIITVYLRSAAACPCCKRLLLARHS